jgi:formylglycine-generating enzyme required for sulfatase activity
MIFIPAGTFRMGDIQGGGESNEQPVHSVSVNQFAMGRYEVTFAEYEKFADATGREKPDDKGWGRSNRPVIYVSWDDATAYTVWLSTQTGKAYRLPTEAEWEYAARAGTDTKYWWGNEIGSNQANCGRSCGDGFEYTAPVGSFAANPFGLYDTVGNLWEWTCSEYENKYSGKEKQCTGENRQPVVRGGSWFNNPRFVRAAYRYGGSLDDRINDVGFRLAR